MLDPIKISKGGKMEIKSKFKITSENLSKVYTPGVAEVVMEIMKQPQKAYDLTWKGNAIAIVTDGSAILGLGNQGPLAAIPVMEGKAVLFKELGGVNAIPIVLGTQDPDEIVQTVKYIAPSFSGINLEDISAPRCFEIEERLKAALDIPVFHDDQHATAVVVLAGLINSLKIVKKDVRKIKIVVSGVGAAGVAIIKLLLKFGAKNILAVDSVGIIHKGRSKKLNESKLEIAKLTNQKDLQGTLANALEGADVFVGVSGPNLIDRNDVSRMNKDAIVFAMANPIPEIMPDEAKKGGAKIVATGRSDFPNQINNALVFPGIFKGALATRTTKITDELKLKAALALAKVVGKPTPTRIIPKVMDKKAVNAIAGVFK